MNLQNSTELTGIANTSFGEVFNFISDLENFYPDFYLWFHNKVINGVTSDNRKIITKRALSGEICAIAILKKHTFEKKICTLRVAKEFKGIGLGAELMEESINWLDCKTPHITVNEENITEFTSFLKKFNYLEPIKVDGYYRADKAEFFYNPPKKFFI